MREIDLVKAAAYQAEPKTARVKHISEALEDFLHILESDPSKLTGLPTRYWPLFNQAFGGLRGELITLTAETGRGKSTFARNWLQDAVHQKIPSAYFSLEEGIVSVMHRLTQMELGKKSHTLEKFDKQALADSLSGFPLYYIDKKGMIEDKLLLNTLEYAIAEHHIQFFVIDHLDYIIKTAGWSNNESYVVGDFLRKLAGIAHEHNVTILLIVHPAKTGEKGLKNREIGIDEMKGSSSIKQESDAVMALFRDKENTYLRFLKIRHHLYSKYLNAMIPYTFNLNHLRFEEDVTKGIMYDQD